MENQKQLHNKTCHIFLQNLLTFTHVELLNSCHLYLLILFFFFFEEKDGDRNIKNC